MEGDHLAKKAPRKILESLSPEEAHEVLLRLADEDPRVTSRAAELSLELITDVDADGIADGVLSTLGDLEVEDVWDSSGKTRHGYVDPNDRAWEMFEQALEPISDEMRRLHGLGKKAAAREYCVGLLRGLWRFEQEGATEFKDWAIDAPHSAFEDVLEEWRKGCRDPAARKAMDDLVGKEFPEWAK